MPIRSAFRGWVVGAGLFAGVLFAHTLFRYAYYADWVPNTAYLKISPDSALVEGQPVVFANNRLVVIIPAKNPAQIQRLQDLARAKTHRRRPDGTSEFSRDHADPPGSPMAVISTV